ncbi:poly-beta-hydroxybutyrate-responsive repressor [Bacillus sp. FJAT-47783]|uniref:poly-beta-hydroxybutyrate-responsive repressor n=1 Tax=Bacillus sp. FJAT-47783 TaxID=2922712 RepID=UPI001FAE5AF4
MTKDKKEFSVSPSKNFILPFILLLLSRMSLHGYELIQKLHSFGFQTLDQGNLYRLLRSLENDNLVISEWDTTGSGPAKRLYSITESGKDYLKTYANQLEHYQTLLDQFFNMYSSILELYLPSFPKEDTIEKQSTTNKGRNSNDTKKDSNK